MFGKHKREIEEKNKRINALISSKQKLIDENEALSNDFLKAAEDKGLIEDRWYKLHSILKDERDKEASLHKKETEYMRGLRFALTAMTQLEEANNAKH